MRALLSSRMRWAKGAAAYDLRNHEVCPASPRAVRWSLLGALAHLAAEETLYVSTRHALIAQVEASEPRMNLHRFNEMATHGELMELLDNAIANLAPVLAGV